MGDLLSRLTASDRRVLDRLCDQGDAWVVGGWVRDSLQGLEPGEMDIATNLRPEVVTELFDKTIPVGAAFGTILVLDEENEKSWEVTTLRSDGTYGDGRRPDEVEFGDDIIEDLARRDFTINAMALDPRNGDLIDEFGGMGDLVAGVVRAVGNAHERISEDGLRIMRAFRFLDAGELESRSLDLELQAAIRDNLHMLSKVSSERKWAELSRIMQGTGHTEVIGLMENSGVLIQVIPETIFGEIERFSGIPAVDLAILCRKDDRSGTKLADHLKNILRLSNDEASTISFLHELKNADLNHEVESFRRFNSALSDSMKEEFVAYFGKLGEEFAQAASEIEPLIAGNKPLVGGEDLMQITGLEAGIRLGRLKGWLHRRQIENNLSNADEVLSLIETIDWQSGDPDTWPALAWP
ncbi:MAG: CCA tRNA nucleotidyltransferase [Candidatus Thermoplasmatota archaeon]|nr:CCA tRNA nucleotidyltransferase [Candidatus Thermoplasmatota archaeon]